MALLISFWWDLLLCFIILLGTLYYLLSKNFEYWKSKGVSGPEPHFIFGNTKKTLLGKTSFMEEFAEYYKENKKQPYLGLYMMQRPVLLVNDLDLIKNVLTKDFEYFTDRPIKFNVKNDPMSDHLFSVTGSRWKNMRVKMTPTFTSSKMREMFNSLVSCCQVMDSHLDIGGEDRVGDVKDILSKLTLDVIGTCIFGIECDSFKNPNSEFRTMSNRIVNPPFWRSILLLMTFFTPKLTYNSGISIAGMDVNDFYLNLIRNAVEYRKKNEIVRKDFLQILMQMLRDDDDDTTDDGKTLTITQAAAQAFIFFNAGFETSSSVASFALYELAQNSDIQNRLVDEIKEYMVKNDGKITYDSLNEMKYLAQVVDETTRKYPTLPTLMRMCTKDYKIPDSNIVIEKDTPIMIPVLGIQRDPDIYPDPDKFDPERFNAENKVSRHHFTHLPFGEGPRICIGIRFGLMQTKLAIISILMKFEVSVCDKTPIPITFSNKTFITQSKSGIWLRMKKRSN